MIDPLAQIVELLRPTATYSKLVSASGIWRVRRAERGRPFYCVMLSGACDLTIGHYSVTLETGDFVLIPAADEFSMSSVEAPALQDIETLPTQTADGEYRLGDEPSATNASFLVGYFSFLSPDARMLLSLLPSMLHVRDEPRLTKLVDLISDETRTRRSARDPILSRLLEVLLIEVLRAETGIAAPRGLVCGLGDKRLSNAIHQMHQEPQRNWTVAMLASACALSRSAFFERFRQIMGVSPMEYLLTWRMFLAKDLLRGGAPVRDVAEQVGYSSTSTFSMAFTRHVGLAPTLYVKEEASLAKAQVPSNMMGEGGNSD